MSVPTEPVAGGLRCTAPLPAARYCEIGRRMALDGCKWDVQVGDLAALASFALVVPRTTWTELAGQAEALAREHLAVETELAHRPELWPRLGLPARVRHALETDSPWTPAAARAVRFDFHPTTEGWRVSEVNSDVPGGYNEASIFTALVAREFPDLRPAGDPLGTLADALATRAGELRSAALLAAPGYPADIQVAAGIAAALRERGCETTLGRPEQLVWRDGHAHICDGAGTRPVGLIYRFYQGDWMTRIAGDCWHPLFRGGGTPVCNPPATVLSESKRLPLLWTELGVEVPTWSRLLPESRAPHVAPGRGDWLLKAAYSNNGMSVFGRGWPMRRGLAGARLQAVLRPGAWVAQRRFESEAVPTPHGPMHVCLGIYTVNGRAAGIYGRLSPHPVIDYLAQDVAVLVEP